MSRPATGRKVLLVGWDAADWKVIQPLIDRGEMPVLEKIVNAGVMGNLSSIRPMISPMLWTSIGTGKRPFKHGVHGFTEVDYELNQVVPVGSTTRQCKAIWNILNEHGLKTQVTAWFATHPAEPLNGACVTDRFTHPVPTQLSKEWKLSKGTVYPERLEEQMSILRVRPEEVPGDVLKMFVRGADKINQSHDKRLHLIAIRLAETFTAHAAATYLLEHEPWDFATVYYRGIDSMSHEFMHFHPPRRAGVFDTEFLAYNDVVNSTYRLHDAMLGRLLHLAGDDVTVIVVSDHGFKSDHTRPFALPNVPAGIAAWHRHTGMVAMRGAGLRQDELIHGASLLDITPTILALYGLPVGSDMDGRVLVEAFSTPPSIGRIDTWDKIDNEPTPQTKSSVRRSPSEEKELVRQFVEIGYIQDPGDDPGEAIKQTTRENRWTLAQSYISAGRYADALPLLESVYEEWPERWDFCCELAMCQLNLDLINEAQETIGEVLEGKKSAGALLLRANLAYRRGNFNAGIKYLEQAESVETQSTALQNQLGTIRLRMHQPTLAEAAFRKAIKLDADDAQAHLGVALCRLRTRQWKQAADFALRALSLRFELPYAHYYLGIALARMGEDDRAIQAFETALRYWPGFVSAHRYLLVLKKRRPEVLDEVERHREFLRGRLGRRKAWKSFRRSLRREAADRARQRAEARQKLRATTRKIDLEPVRPLEPTEFLIVSGLPRSGTSLMMQMLNAASVPLMTDDERTPDENNPRGYFEWEEVKQISKNPYIIEKANGRAIKIISMLLSSLPRKHRYRIIFMQRAIEDIAGSQKKLRQDLSGNTAADPQKMVTWLQQHRDRVLDLLRNTPTVDLLEVDYADLLENPRENLQRIVPFAKIDKDKIDIMAAVVDPTLRHFSGAPVDQVVVES